MDQQQAKIGFIVSKQCQINQVELKNIGPHRDLVVDLGSGVTCIVGANGSGKSTIVNAIYAALTNDFSRLRVEVKTDVISSLSEEGEVSYIVVRGVSAGQEFTLKRGLRGCSSHLEIAGIRYKKAAEILEQVENLLGVSKKVLEHHVFIAQNKMYDFLVQPEAERAKLFQYLCGLERATEVRKACDAFLKRHATQTVVDNRHELRVQLAELETQKAGLTLKSEKLLVSRIDSVKRKRYARVLKQYDEYCHYVKLKEDRDRSEKLFRKAVKGVRDALEQYKKELEELESRRVSKVEYEEASSVLEAEDLCGIREDVLVEIQDLKTKIVGYKEPLVKLGNPRDLSKLDTEITQLDKKVSRLREEYKRFKSLVDNVGNDSVCDTCGQSIDERHLKVLKDSQALAESEGRRLKSELVKLKEERDTESERNKEIEKTHNTVRDLAEQLAEKQLKLKSAVKLKDVESARKLIKDSDDLDFKISQTRIKIAREKALLGRDIDNLKQLLDNEIPVVEEVTEKKKLEAEKRLEEDKALMDKVNQLNYQVAAIDQSTPHLQTAVQTISKKIEENEVRNKALSVVEEISDVLHWGALPKLVAQTRNESLVADINENLAIFGSPFYVEADENLSFKAYFPDGVIVRGKQLSPGQAVVLAIAFRMALADEFKHDIAMMFMDEPTANLDADNVAFLKTALSAASERLGNRQMVIITHEPTQAEFASTTIEVR